MTLELRLEFLSRAIMSAKSCNLRTAASSEGEFLHELEEKLEVLLHHCVSKCITEEFSERGRGGGGVRLVKGLKYCRVI